MKRLLGLAALIAVGFAVTYGWAIHPKGADTPHTTVLPQPGAHTKADDLRVTFLGTSLTAALPTAALEQQIATCTGLDTTITAIAKGGAPSTWGVTQLDRVIASAPDIVFVEFTINDADLRRRISLEGSARAHRTLLDAVQTALPETKIMLLRLNRAFGLRAALRPRQARYDALLPDLAANTPAGYLDLRALWSAQGPSVLPDGIHPTAQAIEDITLPTLANAIAHIAQGKTRCP